MADNCFKQALHSSVAVTKENNIVGVSEVINVDLHTNLNPWVALQGLTKNPVYNIIEAGRVESASLSNAGAYFKR